MKNILLIHRVLSSQADENEKSELDRLLVIDLALKRDFVDMKFLLEHAVSPQNESVSEADWTIFEPRIAKERER